MTGPTTSPAGDEPVVSDNVEGQRYEIQEGDAVAFLAYRRYARHIVLVHTEVPEALGGRGNGARLAKFALEQARADGVRVIAECPFVRTYIERNPEYQDLVRS